MGLQNKRDLVLNELNKNDIDLCCLQETELGPNYPTNILSSSDFELEVEDNDIKKRVGIYINSRIKYMRRLDLEERNTHLIIIDLMLESKIRIISLYRSFRPPGGVSPGTFFKKQLDIVERNIVPNTFILGDFNLDAAMQYRLDYPYKLLYNDLITVITNSDLKQLVDFPTWSRNINNVLKQSVLDHVYTNNHQMELNCKSVNPPFGDHLLIIVELDICKTLPERTLRRDWRSYSTESLITHVSNTNFNIDCTDVQEYWNIFENLLVDIVDELVPLTEFRNENAPKTKPPHNVQTIINRRKKLIKQQKRSPTTETHDRIKKLDKDIKAFFYNQKSSFVRSKIFPGNNKSLWDAVKVAKNQSKNLIPKILTLNNITINQDNAANEFARFFHLKIETIKQNVKIDDAVYNGCNKLLVDERFFMSVKDVEECMSTLKPKNCEGYDRIPVRILYDAREILKIPLATLFRKIYEQKTIPEQWKMAKVVPIFKKGSKSNIENYRPVSNLCSTSKIYEKLILKQINYLEAVNKLDFTGKQQHGFKKTKSTATAGLILQSIIARATDENNYVLMASLDLSAAFDLVNVNLLVKRLKIIGMPKDLVKLIEIWLTDRTFYVEINGINSRVYNSIDGTVQGSVLGPILYAIYVSPLFDLTSLTNFADDNFIIEFNSKVNILIIDMEKKLEMITKWLKESGLKVNENKTELCLFHRNDTQIITINLQNQMITSKKSMNVLGVEFDSKLNWSQQVTNTIVKSNKALCALKLIKKYMFPHEMKSLLISNYYSILYYNSQIWLSPTLCHESKQQLMSASANALRSCINLPNPFISFEAIHKYFKQSTPAQIGLYGISLLLFTIFNEIKQSRDWLAFTDQIIMTGRQQKFDIIRANNYKIGLNVPVNKFYFIRNMIDLNLLNLPYHLFKRKRKIQFKPLET